MSIPLKTRIESLPQELYDEIRALVFTPLEPEEVIHITPSFKPPAVTLVNRHLRDTNLPIFNTWIFIGNDIDLPRWLTSREEDREVCYDVRCWTFRRPKPAALTSLSATAYTTQRVRVFFWGMFVPHGQGFEDCCVHLLTCHVLFKAVAGKGARDSWLVERETNRVANMANGDVKIRMSTGLRYNYLT
ncbi:uncharacterized protein MYCFIDRAFT_174666 [Pseudocercospora fijiensis CIRAD86]|uniref:Uncharacterized protein n=1 Tax=Pseudocercospora fijiensis (strain CIRAD86) TaxID=383855 RepID=M3AF02_PSEFD|nr:uncharacterized protein MYCFIDRAFT_174666 [Pseudocercospora fijiensis CIRAD86]EME83186.1 hypothetical protein MYCFIDRAFT_174666 [Pseudocercospora fijiensis CIRAD86]